MKNDVRDAIKEGSIEFEKNLAQCGDMMSRRPGNLWEYGAQWGIDYQAKRLAETAGQEFDEAWLEDQAIEVEHADAKYFLEDVLHLGKLQHERTAAGYEARIADLKKEIEYIENRYEQLSKVRDDALAKVAELEKLGMG